MCRRKRVRFTYISWQTVSQATLQHHFADHACFQSIMSTYSSCFRRVHFEMGHYKCFYAVYHTLGQLLRQNTTHGSVTSPVASSQHPNHTCTTNTSSGGCESLTERHSCDEGLPNRTMVLLPHSTLSPPDTHKTMNISHFRALLFLVSPTIWTAWLTNWR